MHWAENFKSYRFDYNKGVLQIEMSGKCDLPLQKAAIAVEINNKRKQIACYCKRYRQFPYTILYQLRKQCCVPGLDITRL